MGPRRILFALAALLGGAVISVLMLEIGLQLGSRFASGREGFFEDDADIRIMAVGDSHTYGALIPAAQSYPAHLKAFLDRVQRGRYSVVNLGLPGMSTTQVLNRLPDNVDRYRPDVVIIWCGVNNGWNESEIDAPGPQLPPTVALTLTGPADSAGGVILVQPKVGWCVEDAHPAEAVLETGEGEVPFEWRLVQSVLLHDDCQPDRVCRVRIVRALHRRSPETRR